MTPIKRRLRTDLLVLYALLVPGVLLTFIFQYLPMFSNVIAFMDYKLFEGWMGLDSPWVGFKHFQFISEPWFHKLLWRTLYYNVVGLVLCFPAPLILALLLNEIRNEKFKKVVQSITYVPHFVSWVTVAALFYIFLSVDPSGFVNNVKVALFGGERIVYMQDTGLFLPLLVISQNWKEIGWGSILYLASMTMIDPHLYEAAKVDGAGRWQQMLRITLPAMIPTTLILLIFALGGMVGGNFDQIFNFQNITIQEDTNIINTFTYYKGVKEQQFSLATAVGLFSGIISFFLLMSANYAAKKISDSAII